MIEETSPRGHNPLARAQSLNYGNYGIARSAVIRPATGENTRPILKIALALAPLGAEDVSASNYTSDVLFFLEKLSPPQSGSKLRIFDKSKSGDFSCSAS